MCITVIDWEKISEFIFNLVTNGQIIEHTILIILSVSTLIGVLDYVGFLPKPLRRFFRLNRADDTFSLLKELNIDVDRYKRSNEKLHFPKDLSVEETEETTKTALEDYKINRGVGVGSKRTIEVPYYYDLMGATCKPEKAEYFAQLLSNYWNSEIDNGRKIADYEFDFVVTPKDGSPTLGYEFARLIERPFLLHESDARFSGFDKDMRSVFNCETIPQEGSTALIVDDSTTGGTKVCKAISDLRKYKYKVHTCFVVFEPQTKDAKARLRKMDVELISITKTHDKEEQNKENSSKKVSENEYLKVVFGNAERVFVNFQIGCNCDCKYCYLPELSEYSNPNKKIYTADDIYKMIIEIPGFKEGKKGTILSFGCYSESWCDETRNQTIKLMCKLAKSGNPMQLSTKMRIGLEDILKVDSALTYKNQLLIYLSIPTITQAAEYEPGAHKPSERLSILDYCSKLENIGFAIYIRPVIDSVTINDTVFYAGLMKKFNVPCIVGDYFVKKDFATGSIDDNTVGEGHLSETEPKDLQIIIETLKKDGSVYRHSTELVNDLLNKEK